MLITWWKVKRKFFDLNPLFLYNFAFTSQVRRSLWMRKFRAPVKNAEHHWCERWRIQSCKVRWLFTISNHIPQLIFSDQHPSSETPPMSLSICCVIPAAQMCAVISQRGDDFSTKIRSVAQLIKQQRPTEAPKPRSEEQCIVMLERWRAMPGEAHPKRQYLRFETIFVIWSKLRDIVRWFGDKISAVFHKSGAKFLASETRFVSDKDSRAKLEFFPLANSKVVKNVKL